MDLKKIFFIVVLTGITAMAVAQTIEDYSRSAVYNANIGNYKAAIEEYDKLIEIDRQNCKAYNSRGVLRETCGDYKGALEDYTSAIYANSEFELAYFNRAMLYVFLLKYDQACIDIRKAKELGHKKADNALIQFCK
jgi:tetratricopeptide (TPR) repeat protein